MALCVCVPTLVRNLIGSRNLSRQESTQRTKLLTCRNTVGQSLVSPQSRVAAHPGWGLLKRSTDGEPIASVFATQLLDLVNEIVPQGPQLAEPNESHIEGLASLRNRYLTSCYGKLTKLQRHVELTKGKPKKHCLALYPCVLQLLQSLVCCLTWLLGKCTHALHTSLVRFNMMHNSECDAVDLLCEAEFAAVQRLCHVTSCFR
eukprot:6483338-Amphidinium_carterae.2